MNDTRIAKILTRLLSEQNLKVSELARRVKIPQPTIQRIASGVCENPRTSNLQSIANFFSITIDQLRGIEPIPHIDKISKLPLITWTEAKHWDKAKKTSFSEHVLVDVPASSNAYALKVLDGAMDPVFPRNTILIVDPGHQAKDRSYIIVLVNNLETPIFRQLIINGSDKFLKPLSPDTDIYKITRLKDSDRILGVILQARCNYLD